MTRTQRIEELERLATQRSFTEAELDEWERLQNWRGVRLCRLPRQIEACETKLRRLRQELAVLS
jgi:chaperonin cofactor prefoldin